MRSVFIFLQSLSRSDLESLLEKCPNETQSKIYDVLYNHRDFALVTDHNTWGWGITMEDWADDVEWHNAVFSALHGEPSLGLMVDISGRELHQKEVYAFVRDILTNCHGVAMDDYSLHTWTLAEIGSRNNEGRHFFEVPPDQMEQQER